MEKHTILLDGNTYTLQDHTIIKRQAIDFANLLRLNAQVEAKDFGLYQQISLRGPLPVGQRQGNDPHRCYDQYNVLAMFDGIITRGPNAASPTQSAFASTYKVTSGAGFLEANGYLMIHGDASAVAGGEPCYYFIGSTTTWTDCTLNADLTADVGNITGVTFAEGYWWAVANQLQSDGTWNRITYKAIGTTPTPTVWQRANTGGASEALASTPIAVDRLKFLEYAAATRTFPSTVYLYSLGYVAASGRTTFTWRGTADGNMWAAPLSEMPSDSTPRGLKLMRGYDGVLDVMGSTNVGLYRLNSGGAGQVANEIYRYASKGGSYTGVMDLAQDNSLYIADGPQLKRFRWTDGLGASAIDVLHLDVPTAALGDITAIVASRERPWIYVARGGLAASRNARIYVFDINIGREDPNHAWFCIYQHGTAQRAILALSESSQDDGTTRLHFMVEAAAGGDQDALLFASITTHPLELSTYSYAASGTLLDSERKPLGGLTAIGYGPIQVDADNMSSVKAVTIRNGQNGATPANSQTITSTTSPAQIWPDKTDGTAGIGVSAKRQQIEFDIKDTAATTTVGPTLKEMTITYFVKSLMPDGTTPEEFEFTVDLEASRNNSTFRSNSKNVLQALKATADKVILQALTLDGGEVVYVHTKIDTAEITAQLQAPIQQGTGAGFVVVKCRESVRGS